MKGPTRREFVAAATGSVLSVGVAGAANAAPASPAAGLPGGADDRAYMLGILEKMATPVLGRMSRSPSCGTDFAAPLADPNPR